jgi:hypothetical protein
MPSSACPPWQTDKPAGPAGERNDQLRSYTTSGDTIPHPPFKDAARRYTLVVDLDRVDRATYEAIDRVVSSIWQLVDLTEPRTIGSR